MLKIISSITLLILIIALSSCENSVDTEESIFESALLRVDNDYYFHYSEISGYDSVYYLTDWFSHTIITGYTVINSKKYYLNNYGEFYTIENKIVYFLENGLDKIQLDYTVKIGDTCYFIDKKVIVQNITTENIFGENQKTFKVSNLELSDSILVTGKYCTKFGLLNSSITRGNNTNSKYLKNVTIDGNIYK